MLTINGTAIDTDLKRGGNRAAISTSDGLAYRLGYSELIDRDPTNDDTIFSDAIAHVVCVEDVFASSLFFLSCLKAGSHMIAPIVSIASVASKTIA